MRLLLICTIQGEGVRVQWKKREECSSHNKMQVLFLILPLCSNYYKITSQFGHSLHKCDVSIYYALHRWFVFFSLFIMIRINGLIDKIKEVVQPFAFFVTNILFIWKGSWRNPVVWVCVSTYVKFHLKDLSRTPLECQSTWSLVCMLQVLLINFLTLKEIIDFW